MSFDLFDMSKITTIGGNRYCSVFIDNSRYSSIPGNRNWQIETADWNFDVRLDILGFRGKETLCTPRNIA